MVFLDRSAYSVWNDCCECVNIACALRCEVASVGIFSIGRGSPDMRKYFRFRKYTSGRCSCETAIVKKVGLWLVKSFCKPYEQTSFALYFSYARDL